MGKVEGDDVMPKHVGRAVGQFVQLLKGAVLVIAVDADRDGVAGADPYSGQFVEALVPDAHL